MLSIRPNQREGNYHVQRIHTHTYIYAPPQPKAALTLKLNVEPQQPCPPIAVPTGDETVSPQRVHMFHGPNANTLTPENMCAEFIQIAQAICRNLLAA